MRTILGWLLVIFGVWYLLSNKTAPLCDLVSYLITQQRNLPPYLC
jgi:hypothetical protein